jgi:HSP20 family protein
MHSLFLPVGMPQESAWRPAADVCRTRYGWLVKFDLAGVRVSDLEVLACANRLTVRGRRRDWTEEEGCTYYRMEIAYCRFERSLELPCNLESADISSEYRDGMLLIRIRTEGGPT